MIDSCGTVHCYHTFNSSSGSFGVTDNLNQSAHGQQDRGGQGQINMPLSRDRALEIQMIKSTQNSTS